MSEDENGEQEEYEFPNKKKNLKLDITLDTSKEYERLKEKGLYFDKHASMVFQKALKLGIECELPKDEGELILLASQIQDKDKPLASGQTPLSGQYGSSGYSADTPLNEREYSDYPSMCEDLKSEVEKGGERGKEAQEILDRLLEKEVRQVLREPSYGSGEYHGSIVDLQKDKPQSKLSPEKKEQIEEELEKRSRKWRVPRD